MRFVIPAKCRALIALLMVIGLGVYAIPGFGYGSGPPDGPNYTQVLGSFTANTTATGSVIFRAYPGCGNAGGVWTATKR